MFTRLADHFPGWGGLIFLNSGWKLLSQRFCSTCFLFRPFESICVIWLLLFKTRWLQGLRFFHFGGRLLWLERHLLLRGSLQKTLWNFKFGTWNLLILSINWNPALAQIRWVDFAKELVSRFHFALLIKGLEQLGLYFLHNESPLHSLLALISSSWGLLESFLASCPFDLV